VWNLVVLFDGVDEGLEKQIDAHHEAEENGDVVRSVGEVLERPQDQKLDGPLAQLFEHLDEHDGLLLPEPELVEVALVVLLQPDFVRVECLLDFTLDNEVALDPDQNQNYQQVEQQRCHGGLPDDRHGPDALRDEVLDFHRYQYRNQPHDLVKHFQFGFDRKRVLVIACPKLLYWFEHLAFKKRPAVLLLSRSIQKLEVCTLLRLYSLGIRVVRVIFIHFAVQWI